MSRKSDKEYEREEKRYKRKSARLKDETVQSIVAVVCFILALFMLLGAFAKAGIVGSTVYSFLHNIFGFGYFLIPLILLMLGIAFFQSLDRKFPLIKIFGGLLFFVSGLGLMEIGKEDLGGQVGGYISSPLIGLFDVYSTVAFLFAFVVISLLIIFDTHIKSEWIGFLNLFRFRRKKEIPKIEDVKIAGGVEDEDEDDEEEDVQEERKEAEKKSIFGRKKEAETEEESFIGKSIPILTHGKTYIPPPVSLLENDRGKPGVGDIKSNANIIKRTLQNFGIDVEMDEVTIGPTITRYAMKPAEGVKLSRIIGLQDNLALALAAPTIRIEAPIPGKSLVGIEVPNSVKTIVGLGSMIGSKEFQGSPKALLVSIGKDVTGNPQFDDLGRMPHLLIAGTTGSGKSVAVHSILTSLLYKNSPDMLKFIMVDAKRVELPLYNKIPHLLTPVITDAKKTILALKWAAKEMDRRYEILEKESVRDINSYHKNIVEPVLKNSKDDESLPETMPYIVIVIDELADLMQAYPRELEAAIVRLAQMSRAVGIHLILSTQRPSVNVITGLIKANIPTRIALKVNSQVDSRTIIDKAGAEKLVGQGDMLFVTQNKQDPTRIQSPFISEGEVKKVVKYLVDNFRDEIPNQGIALTPGNDEDDGRNPIFDSSSFSDQDDDELYEEARQIVIEAGKASTSYLQRKLRIGYARAARLMDILEERGVIGAADGAKPREVIGNEGYGKTNEEENTVM